MQDKKIIRAADWWDHAIFRDESIKKPPRAKKEKLPAPLAKARKLENGGDSRASLFLKQGRLLADYEDDYCYHGDSVRYYPTYQSLSNDELRGYFAWRTKARQGVFCPTSISFIFLYIYELINQIGVKEPLSGYEKLLEINYKYGSGERYISYYLEQWLMDYIVYYDLDKSLLADKAQVSEGQCVSVLENLADREQDEVIESVKQLAPKWLRRSKFYANHYEDMNEVIYIVLQRMAKHYDKTCKKNFAGQFFGSMYSSHIHIFSAAIFANPLERRNYEYKIDDQYIYRCANGIWTVNRRPFLPRSVRKLEDLLKTIDSIMRTEYAYGHPILAATSVKWITRIITEETRALLARKAAPAKIVPAIDLSQLARIREDAEITRDKLIVEEESDARDAEPPEKPEDEASSGQALSSLAAPELRLLQCLLEGKDIGWIQKEGHMLSVLVDAVNEKLYDIFGDSVIDDKAALVEDYIEDLKEMMLS